MHVRLSKSIQGFASIKTLKYEVFKVKFRTRKHFEGSKVKIQVASA